MSEIEERSAPTFEGREVNKRELKLSGSVAVNASMDGAHELDDEVVVIGTFKVDKIGHEVKPKKGLLRIEGATAIDLFVVTDSLDALQILHQAKAERDAAFDALLGRTPLPFDDEGAVTDAEIQRMTEEELAKPEPDPKPGRKTKAEKDAEAAAEELARSEQETVERLTAEATEAQSEADEIRDFEGGADDEITHQLEEKMKGDEPPEE